MPTGMESTIKIAIGNFLLTAVDFGNTLYQINDAKKVDIDTNNILLFDRKSGKAICAGKVTV